ncbi:uncharacterized protein LACBIDRAFT_297065 [Laccaria bicolor S238N-H82]|uniref:Predicted protein n=1 Tax=Laccaria bicolor (strain S238N-H82 / ATCC MYA-4686) TaxID=486041 RepID=B0D9X3_LACBS|nr:uncharacterized protein LACBIDRAFT_297065 [Laccaria bicolor S238N-H82]EDR08661.1 predicted protein [Laccaria bicolor S238N-H82]|eukprot:XP_001880886.1 predicted protein [Laccaria bicolor S238N-H82]
MCMLFGFLGGITMLWQSVGDGILTSTSRRVGFQMRRQCLFLTKHRCRTRIRNSGTICSSAYTTTLSVAPLSLQVMAVHLRLLRCKALQFSSHLRRGLVYIPPPRTISQLWVSFLLMQSLMSWFQSTIQTHSIIFIVPSLRWSSRLLKDT